MLWFFSLLKCYLNMIDASITVLAYIVLILGTELIYRLTIKLPSEVICYNVGVQRAAHIVFGFSQKTIVFGIILFLCSATFGQTTLITILASSEGAKISLSYFVSRLISQSKSPAMDEVDFIRRSNGLDYGSGMAISYYFGYLKIVLPSTEEEHSKSIKERLEDFEDSQGVNVPVKKLVILAPNTMYTPGKLSGDNLIESRNLETIVLNRAGITKRSYHNTIYKIKDTNWYVAAEGASPLQTFYQAMSTSELLQRNREAIVDSFVKKLRQLLYDDLSCRNLCEVVLFNTQNEHGLEPDYGLFLREFVSKKLNLA